MVYANIQWQRFRFIPNGNLEEKKHHHQQQLQQQQWYLPGNLFGYQRQQYTHKLYRLRAQSNSRVAYTQRKRESFKFHFVGVLCGTTLQTHLRGNEHHSTGKERSAPKTIPARKKTQHLWRTRVKRYVRLRNFKVAEPKCLAPSHLFSLSLRSAMIRYYAKQ